MWPQVALSPDRAETSPAFLTVLRIGCHRGPVDDHLSVFRDGAGLFHDLIDRPEETLRRFLGGRRNLACVEPVSLISQDSICESSTDVDTEPPSVRRHLWARDGTRVNAFF